MNTMNRLALLSFMSAVVVCGVQIIFNTKHELFRVAASFALLAFFLALLENYVRDAPVPMRSGPVRKEDAPLRYRFIYFCMIMWGLMLLLVTWTN
jgi:hypothetical protein